MARADTERATDSIEITFSDGSQSRHPRGISVREALEAWGGADLGRAVAGKLDGRVVDLSAPITEDVALKPLSFDDPEGREVFSHSASHIMAQAVRDLFPEAKLAIGPAIADGFYYDFDVARPFTPEDLERIEKRMAEIVADDIPFERDVASREAAIVQFREQGETYKVELLEDLPDHEVTLYRHGDFVDLCRGPHLPSTGRVKAFKLLSAAGAYWRGDERRPMLQRIYGTAYESEEDLALHLERLEEAKRRDHRRLGTELDLFSMEAEGGSGLVYWHPKGALLRMIIEDWWKAEHLNRGYQLVVSPHIARGHLWQRSGHYDFYRDNMFVLDVDEEEYVLKPMNCPGHILIYQSRVRSYRELPIRFAELGVVYRHERSGVVHGLMRVRGITQDDAHIYCTPEQLPEEIGGVIDFAQYLLHTFGFDQFEVDLSVRDPAPEAYAGSPEDWERAESVLEEAIRGKGLDFERKEGEAVFYGPKIDIHLLDSLGRRWQCSTIQFDFNMPQRFDVRYVGQDGHSHHVVMVHRALFGSLERFIGVLIEHYGGAFPLWLAPVQARVLPITDDQHAYAAEVYEALVGAGLRTELDDRNEKVGYKISEAERMKIPYMLIVGKREQAARHVSLRKHGEGDLGPVDLAAAVQRLTDEAAARR
ncbi:threonyl-tRNA synthetase [candidate division TA06 bacterium SM1_40]|uniref:Threonine--tRNA ligase n=2 Tax=Bacteria division TA06 TaxID=1156500 RepID=A0A0S8JDT4_UNCT6|nr:MAG: threonyl-tRNA synthetase [candidate division TA06 bacterium SM23_40]KPL07889.1 MAG: threonyl-tRNA synthetase [candidate division TA06 bacterium SM1_40]